MELLKVIIVEDEILVRVGIKSCLDWEQHGFEIVGQAEDGLQALDLIREKSPHIILTDIKMPVMDGLELIAVLKEQYPHIKTIVLSCHNELDFVKRAMKLGAEDYILKLSMQPESLLEVLNKTRQAIETDKENLDDVRSIQLEFRKNKYLIKENLYKKVISGSITANEIARELTVLGTVPLLKRFVVLCVGIDDYLNAPVKSSIQDKHLLKFSFINILEEVLTEFCPGEIAEINNGEYIVVMDFTSMEPGIYWTKTAENYCRKVLIALKTYLNISVSFGIASLHDDLGHIRDKYLEALRAMEERFYMGRESIVFFDRTNTFSDKMVLLNDNEEKLLTGHLENLDAYGAKLVISRFLDEIAALHVYAPAKVRMAAVEIMHSLIRLYKKYDADPEVITLRSDSNPVDILMNSETITDIRDCFDELIDRFIEYSKYFRQNTARPEIIKLKRYILEHVCEDISLDKASQISNISRSYLSSIFKKETGESLTDYINRVKMEAAMELIRKFGLKTYEVAEKVGISDESYFSKLFKKYMGISPSRIGKTRQ